MQIELIPGRRWNDEAPVVISIPTEGVVNVQDCPQRKYCLVTVTYMSFEPAEEFLARLKRTDDEHRHAPSAKKEGDTSGG